jgi:uncharacterized protein (DUF488 family)
VSDVFTIGHSNHTIAEFVSLLHESEIPLVIDVRAIPRSRTNPQFNKDALPLSLREAGVCYEHLPQLGGRRQRPRAAPPSPNTFWQNASFRNYADYAATDEFRAGFVQLRELARMQRSVIMCSEVLWWRCHRRIISDYLLAQGVQVLHVMGHRKIERATLTPHAQRLADGSLVYPP